MELTKTFADCRLVPLRIPGGWIVKHNTFHDEPFRNPDGTLNRFHNDSPDLLLIRQVRGIVNNQWSDDEKDCLLLDVGWKYLLTPQNTLDKSDGYYKVQLLRGNFSEGTTLLIEEHKSIADTIAAVERILMEQL